MRCRFVQPEVVRLSLSEGEFIDVKKQLTAGEQRRVFGDLVTKMSPGEKIELDPNQVGRTKIVAYVVGWSLTDAEGKPVPFSADALDNLDTETYKEIDEAVDAHVEREDAAREARKNVTAAGASSGPISPSAA